MLSKESEVKNALFTSDFYLHEKTAETTHSGTRE
jgi:hypothetical protein